MYSRLAQLTFTMKLKTSGKWKSVEIDPFLQAKGFAEGLLGIEELPSSSYDIIGKKNKSSYVVDNVSTDDDDDIDISENKGKYVLKRANFPETNDAEPPKKKKKTRQKRKPKEKSPKSCTKSKPESKDSCFDPTNDKKPHSDVQNSGGETIMGEISLPQWENYGIATCVLKALQEKGFVNPTEIQREVIPSAIEDHRDIVAAAETGSGKTLAFGIPIITGIVEARQCNPADIEGAELDSENVNVLDINRSLKESDSNEVSDAESFEDMSDDETQNTGCVKVVNNVIFDFETDIVEGEQSSKHVSDIQLKRKKLQALVLTPTRELAIQVRDHLVAASKYAGIQVAVVVGGMAPQKQSRMLRRCPEIVVATPGRLWDLIEEGDPHLQGVRNLRYLAIDETDRMLEKGHFEELHKLLEMINSNKPHNCKKRQNFVLSATLSMVHDMPSHLKNKKNKKALTSQGKLSDIMGMIGVRADPKIVDITRKTATAQTLIESQIRCSLSEKDQYLYYFFVQHPGRTLVFCNSIDCVRRLVNLFQLLECEPLGLHAQMQQRQRLKNLDRFVSNPTAVLIATDVAARGLDIKDVQHVVHYQVPRTAEGYVHRSGRTARAQKEGLSVIMIEPGENIMYKKTCHTLKRKEELPEFPIDNSIFSSVKKRVQVARELDKLLLTTKKEDVNKSWLKKTAEEADIDYSEDSDEDCTQMKDEASFRLKEKEANKRKSSIDAKRYELKQLLCLPVTQYGFSGKYPTMTGQLQLPSDFKGIYMLIITFLQ